MNIKKFAFGLVVAAGLTVSTMGTAQAQDWRHRGQVQPQRNGGYGQVDSNGNIDRNHNGIDDRYETRDGRVDINQNGVADQDERNGRYGRNNGNYGRNDQYGRNGSWGRNDGYNRNDGYYGNGGYGVNSGEFQQGYRDGLTRGREDAQTNRAMDPNNSSHYRNGDQAYRAGFERGFYE